jgi:glutaredoxin
VKLKELLHNEGIAFTELSKEEAIQRNLWRETFKTVPQLWMNGQHIGGYSDYIQLKTQSLPEESNRYDTCEACEA